MLDNGKITSRQLACMLFLCVLAISVLITPFHIYQFAGNDMIFTPAIGSLAGILAVFAVVWLHRLFPGKTIVEYGDAILGRPLGKAFSLLLLLVILIVNGTSLRLFAELISLSFLPRTPLIVIVGTMMIVSAITVRCGVDVIGRLAVVITPLLLGIILLHFFPLGAQLQPSRLLPLFREGLVPVMKGSLMLQSFFPIYTFMAFFLPFVSDVRKAGKWGVISVLWSTAAMTGSMVVVLMFFGKAASVFTFPLLTMSRYIDFFGVIQHLESLIMVLWVVDVFVRTIVIHYAATIGFAQWFGVSDYKPLALPLGMLTLLLTLWGVPRFADLYKYHNTINPIYYSLFFILCPLLLLAVAKLRGASPPPKTRTAPRD